MTALNDEVLAVVRTELLSLELVSNEGVQSDKKLVACIPIP